MTSGWMFLYMLVGLGTAGYFGILEGQDKRNSPEKWPEYAAAAVMVGATGFMWPLLVAFVVGVGVVAGILWAYESIRDAWKRRRDAREEIEVTLHFNTQWYASAPGFANEGYGSTRAGAVRMLKRKIRKTRRVTKRAAGKDAAFETTTRKVKL